MKINKRNQIGFDSNMALEGFDARIDDANMHKLWDLLQDPYKNPIGAVVREYVSNSFDSHAEADFIKHNTLADIRLEYSVYRDMPDEEINALKTQLNRFDNQAVQVSIESDEAGHYWATEDFGVGLSPDRVKDVFCSYLKSTKEDTNNLIGAFGIGSKSGLSYTDIVHIRTRYNGEEFQYMLRKGEKTPRLEVLNSMPTTEMNGTQIKIYLKEVTKRIKKGYYGATEEVKVPQIDEFKNECRKQLAYFDNVYFSEGTEIENYYSIAQGQTWIKSSNGMPFQGLHLCLGKVAYPIDWDQLGIDTIPSEAGLKFEIGELDIIQTREDVKYTPRTKKVILDKIEEFKKEIKAKWEKDNEYETDNFNEYLKNRGQEGIAQYELPLGEDYWTINFHLNHLFAKEDIPDWEFIPFKKANINGAKIKESNFFIDYSIPSYVNDTGLKHCNHGSAAILRLVRNDIVYRMSGNHETKHSKYICHEVENGRTFYMLRKKKNVFKPLQAYISYWKLDDYPKSEWRKIITTIQKTIQNFLIENTKSYDRVTVDPDWLKSQRSGNKRVYDNTLFNVYQFTDQFSYNGSWKSAKYKKGDVDRMNRTLFIAGYKEDVETLKEIGHSFHAVHSNDKFRMGDPSTHLKVVYVAKQNTKYLADAPNLITMDNYKQQRLFALACTADKIMKEDELNILAHLKSYSGFRVALHGVSSKISSIVVDLVGFLDKYQSVKNNTRTHFYNDVYEYVEENDLFVQEYIDMAETIKEYLKHIHFIDSLNYNILSSEDLARAIYRFNKSVSGKHHLKMNPNYYINFNDEELKWMTAEDRDKYRKVRMI
jgi:hypothetical protein